MNIQQILAIILFTIQFTASLIWDGKDTKINFPSRTFSIILWNIILYFGGFWD